MAILLGDVVDVIDVEADNDRRIQAKINKDTMEVEFVISNMKNDWGVSATVSLLDWVKFLGELDAQCQEGTGG